MPDRPDARDSIWEVLAEAGRQLQAAGDDLSEHVGFVAVARALQSAGEVLAGAQPPTDE